MCSTKAFDAVWLYNGSHGTHWKFTVTFINESVAFHSKDSIDALKKDLESCKWEEQDRKGQREGRRSLWPIRGSLGWVGAVWCTCGGYGFRRESSHHRTQEWCKAGGFSKGLDTLRERAGWCSAVAGAGVRAARL